MIDASNFTTFNAAIEACIANNENVLHVPRKVNGSYPIASRLPDWPGGRLIIQGEGYGSMLNITGSGCLCIPGCVLKIRDCRIYGHPRNRPAVGVCFCRTESGIGKADSINGCQLSDVTVEGEFSGAAVHVLCAEQSTIQNSQIYNKQGHGICYDTNDRLGTGHVTDMNLFTNSHHHLIHCGVCVWNMTGDVNKSPIVIAGNTDGFVGQSLHITADSCRAYVAVESYPQSYGRANVPRWNRLESSGWETTPGKEPYYGIVYRRMNGQVQYPETLRNLPAIRWQTGPSWGQETVT